MNNNVVIECEDVYFKYPEANKMALRNVNLEINEGDFIAIIGQNGAGKTTLTKLFNGLHEPTKGKVFLDKEDIEDMKTNEIIKRIGYCYQNPDHQLFSRTVYDEVEYGPNNLDFSKEEVKERVQQALEVTSLDDKQDRYPFTLGKGERQRLAIASVISMGSPILVVDEPTTGLDTNGIVQIMNLITEWNQRGHTVIVVTHDINMVAKYVPQTMVMANGRILAKGNTREVLTKKEKLKKAFVKQPQVTRIGDELSEHGISHDVMTIEELYNEIKDKIEEKQDYERRAE